MLSHPDRYVFTITSMSSSVRARSDSGTFQSMRTTLPRIVLDGTVRRGRDERFLPSTGDSSDFGKVEDPCEDRLEALAVVIGYKVIRGTLRAAGVSDRKK